MKTNNRSTTPPSRLGIYTIVQALGWSGAIITSLIWNLSLFKQETREIALNVARTHIESEISYRRWNAMHGGVYAPVAGDTAPNPYLAGRSDREVHTPAGVLLTLINHEVMTRQVNAMAHQALFSQGHVVSLSPLDLDNAADDWERKALESFARGAPEASAFVEQDGQEYVRLLRPFPVDVECLQCHAGQGFKTGDIRGGINVLVPLAPLGSALRNHVSSLWVGHGLWWLLGIFGILASFLGMRRHTAERRRAEESLVLLKHQQEQILHAAANGICGIDQHGVITFVNPAAATMLGWQANDLVGQSLVEVVGDAGAGSTVSRLSDSCRDGQVHQASDVVFQRKGGTSFLVEYVSTPIMEEDQVQGAVITFVDSTVRRQAVEEMAGMRRYLQNVIDAMPSVLIGVDKEGRVTQWNSEAEKVVGLDSAKARGRRLEEIMPMFAERMPEIKAAMQEKKPMKIERLWCPVRGVVRYADVVIYPLSRNEIEEAVIRVDDVTERVQAEDETIQAEKLMSVASLVEGMAHEINNPLGGIMQGAQTVARRLSPDLPINVEVATACGVDLQKISRYMEQRDINRFLDGIQAAGKRAARIVSYMLQFSRDREATKEYTDLAVLVDRAVDLVCLHPDLAKQFDFSRLEIIREYEDDIPKVFCSIAEMEQVLVNLLKNAVQVLFDSEKTSPAHSPRITLRIRLESENDLIWIEVEDNGPGIEEKSLRRVFEPFFTTKPPGEGTGLGLSVAYFIVTVTHQGSMNVESAPGRGARFIIKLPLTRDSSGVSGRVVKPLEVKVPVAPDKGISTP